MFSMAPEFVTEAVICKVVTLPTFRSPIVQIPVPGTYAPPLCDT